MSKNKILFNKKRFIYLLFLSFFVTNLVCAQPNITLNKFENQRINQSQVKETHPEVRQFAENGMVDSVIYNTFDRWEEYQKHKETYKYDETNNYYFVLDKIWGIESNSWMNYSFDSSSYDVNGNEIETLGKLWNDDKEWENWWRSDYTFNDGRKTRWEYYNWLLFSGWSPGVKENYFYDESGKLILKEAVNNFENTWRDSLIYNDQGNLLVYFAEDWENEQWVNDWQETYSYDEKQNITEILREVWSGTSWVNYWRDIYTYDANDDLIIIKREWFSSGDWELFARTSYSYNDNQRLVYGKYEIKEDSDWVLANGLLEFFDDYRNNYYFGRHAEIIVHYNGITEVKEKNNIPDNFELKQNYPNPFNPSTNIEYSISEPANVKLIVYDILGNEVAELVNENQTTGSYRYTFDGSKLSSGTYFVQLNAGKFREIRKISLVK